MINPNLHDKEMVASLLLLKRQSDRAATLHILTKILFEGNSIISQKLDGNLPGELGIRFRTKGELQLILGSIKSAINDLLALYYPDSKVPEDLMDSLSSMDQDQLSEALETLLKK